MQQIYNQVVSNYQTSAAADIEQFVTDNTHMCNRDFVWGLVQVSLLKS